MARGTRSCQARSCQGDRPAGCDCYGSEFAEDLAGSLKTMATFAMLSTLGPDGWETLRQHPERIHQVRSEVEAIGLKVVAQYALMGQYDFLNIIEAPDEHTMAKAAIMLAARGTMRTTTLAAIPVDDLVAMLQSDLPD